VQGQLVVAAVRGRPKKRPGGDRGNEGWVEAIRFAPGPMYPPFLGSFQGQIA